MMDARSLGGFLRPPPPSSGANASSSSMQQSEILTYLSQDSKQQQSNNAVFDPSDFPSLGGGRQTSNGSNSGVLASSSSATIPSEKFTQQRNVVASSSGAPSHMNQASQNNPFTQAVQQSGGQQVTSSGSRHDLSLAGSFGLLGLLGVIRMEDADRSTLALGTDLTTLGVNLNSSETLNGIFSTPLDDPTPREPVFSLPASYPKSSVVRPDLFEKLQLDSLFVCFYTMPRDVCQVLAAQELMNRGWRFHETAKMWFSQAKNGSLLIFDLSTWEKRVFAARAPDGFESGFLSPEVLLTTVRAAVAQAQQQASRSAGGWGGGAI